jgi:glycosyltransferase involved in cell wall biosynthesis
VAVDKFLEEESVDVINVHYIPALFALRNMSSDRRILYTFHGPWAGESCMRFSGKMDGKSPIMRGLSRIFIESFIQCMGGFLEKRCIARCHRFMTISSYMRNLLVSTYNVDPSNVSVIPSGVNAEVFYPEDDNVLRARIAGSKSFVFLTVRRLEKRMGLDILIRSCAILKEKFPDFVLLIGGKGIQFDYLQNLISSTGCSENVQMLGFIPETELRKYLSLSDLFILPSRDLEGFGLVVLESMACGTPVLVSPRGGPREVVDEFDSRFVLSELEPDVIAEKLLELIQSGALHEKSLITNCLDFVSGRYSWKYFASDYINWIEGSQ